MEFDQIDLSNRDLDFRTDRRVTCTDRERHIPFGRTRLTDY